MTFLITALVVITALVRTGQVRIFWTHLRTDNELDQVTVDHFRNSDYVRGIKPKPMAPSDVYIGYFGGVRISGTSSSCYPFRENVLRRNTFFISTGCFFPRGTSGLLDL